MTPYGLLQYLLAGAVGLFAIGCAGIAVVCVWGWLMAPREGER